MSNIRSNEINLIWYMLLFLPINLNKFKRGLIFLKKLKDLQYEKEEGVVLPCM